MQNNGQYTALHPNVNSIQVQPKPKITGPKEQGGETTATQHEKNRQDIIAEGVADTVDEDQNELFEANETASFLEEIQQQGDAEGVKKRLSTLNRFTLFFKTLVDEPDFDLMVVLVIVANCVVLAMHSPTQAEKNVTLDRIDLAFNIVFTVELAIRAIGAGSLIAYFRDLSNLFDFCMVVLGYTSLFQQNSESYGFLSALRSLRALRPLRTITKLQSLKAIVICFLEAVPLLVTVTLLLFFCLFLFAIAAMKLFLLTYHYQCVDQVSGLPEIILSNSVDEFGCHGNRKCPDGYICQYSDQNLAQETAGFDNILLSMATVFQAMTMAGWSYIMYRVIDYSNAYMVIYFVLLIISGPFFVVNLFIAVLKLKFGKAQKSFYSRKMDSKQAKTNAIIRFARFAKVSGQAVAELIRPKQQREGYLQRLSQPSEISLQDSIQSVQQMDQLTTIIQNNGSDLSVTGKLDDIDITQDGSKSKLRHCWNIFRYYINKMVENPKTGRFLMFCIIMNTIILACEYDGMSESLKDEFNKTNTILSLIFGIEMVLKLIAMGPVKYFRDGFNVFDALLVVASIIEVISASLNGSVTRSFKALRVLKSFRVLRIIKVFRYLQSLRKIAEVLLVSLSSFFAIAFLSIVFLVIYAIIGLHLFGNVETGRDFPNFKTFLGSVFTMFQILSLEDYEIIMYSYIRNTNYAAYLYFVSWVILGKYIFLTLFLAVTLEAFESKYDSKAFSEAYVAYRADNDDVDGQQQGYRESFQRTSSTLKTTTDELNPYDGDGKDVHDNKTDTDHGSKAKINDPQTQLSQKITRDLSNSHSTGRYFTSTVSMDYKNNQPIASEQVINLQQSSIDQKSSANLNQFQTSDVTDKLNKGSLNLKHSLQSQPVAEKIDQEEKYEGQGILRQDSNANFQYQQSLKTKGLLKRCAQNQDLVEGECSFQKERGFSTRKKIKIVQSDQKLNLQIVCSDCMLKDIQSLGQGFNGQFYVGESSSSAVEYVGRSPRTAYQLPNCYEIEFQNQKYIVQSLKQLTNRLKNSKYRGQVLYRSFFNLTAAEQRVTSNPRHSSYTDHIRIIIIQILLDMFSTRKNRKNCVSLKPGRAYSLINSVIRKGHNQRWQKQKMKKINKQLNRVQRALGLLDDYVILVLIMSNLQNWQSRCNDVMKDKQLQLCINQKNKQKKLQSVQIRKFQPNNQRRPVCEGIAWEDNSSLSLQQQQSELSIVKSNIEISQFNLQSSTNNELAKDQASNAFSRDGNNDQSGMDTNIAPTHRQNSIIKQIQTGSFVIRPMPVPKLVVNPVDSCTDMVTMLSQEDNLHSARSNLSVHSAESTKIDQIKQGLIRQLSSPRSPRIKPIPFTDIVPFGSQNRPSVNQVLQSQTIAQSSEQYSKRSLEKQISGISNITNTDISDQQMSFFRVFGSLTPQRDPPKPKEEFPIRSIQHSATFSSMLGRHKPSDIGFTHPGHQSFSNTYRQNRLTSQSSIDMYKSTFKSRLCKLPQVQQLQKEAEVIHKLMNRQSDSGHGDDQSTDEDLKAQQISKYMDSGPSFFIFGPENQIRRAVYDIVTHKHFDNVMFFFILANCVTMTFEKPSLDTEGKTYRALWYLDVIFTAIFTLEAIMKIFAFTFLDYAKLMTNQVDLSIVISSILLFLLNSLNSMNQFKFIKSLRVLRAIKPLRTLTRSAGMQLVIKALSLSMVAMANVSIIILFAFILFGILGVQLFKGKFYTCSDESVNRLENCHGEYFDENLNETRQRVWSKAMYNFDHLGNALLALFVTVSLDGYADILYLACEVTGSSPGSAENPASPPDYINYWAFLYFVVFIAFCAFCMVNLYIGVVFFQFSRIRLLSQNGSVFLNKEQQQWLEIGKHVCRMKPTAKAPVINNKFRLQCRQIVMTSRFDTFITGVILFNILLMASVTVNERPSITSIKEIFSVVISFIFLLEAILKILAYGWKFYIKNHWNKFDFCLVVESVIDFVIVYGVGQNDSSLVKVLKIQKMMRILRISRMFKLVKGQEGVKSLLQTLVTSLPAFWNVGAVLMLFYYLYSYVGVLAFGKVKPGIHINEHANFNSFGKAMQTLFRVSTGDEWRGIMNDCMVKKPDCDGEDCGSRLAIPYFISFFIMVSLIMLNLFTAVIIENFEAQQDRGDWPVSQAKLDEFTDLWLLLDDGTHKLTTYQLFKLLRRLGEPFGVDLNTSETDTTKFIYDLQLPLVSGRFSYQHTIMALTKRLCYCELPDGKNKQHLQQSIDKYIHKAEEGQYVLQYNMVAPAIRACQKWRAKTMAARIKQRREWYKSRRTAVSINEVLKYKDKFLRKALLSKEPGVKYVIREDIQYSQVAQQQIVFKWQQA